MAITLVIALAATLTPSTPYAASDLAVWKQLLARSCPGSHISEWMPERNKADLVDDFVDTLSREKQSGLRRVADSKGVCAGAEFDNANACEVITDIHALRQRGLLGPFTRFACSVVRCSEPAICERPAPR